MRWYDAWKVVMGRALSLPFSFAPMHGGADGASSMAADETSRSLRIQRAVALFLLRSRTRWGLLGAHSVKAAPLRRTAVVLNAVRCQFSQISPAQPVREFSAQVGSRIQAVTTVRRPCAALAERPKRADMGAREGKKSRVRLNGNGSSGSNLTFRTTRFFVDGSTYPDI